jgi:hypothetical protein
MRVLLLAAFLKTTTSRDGPPPPGVLRDQWLQGFQNMKKLKDSRHPKAINDPAFFMEVCVLAGAFGALLGVYDLMLLPFQNSDLLVLLS